MTSLFATLAQITAPYDYVEAETFQECEKCGCFTDRNGCNAVSNCCGAKRTDNDSYLCPECKKPAEFTCEEGGCDD